jgi:pimeloyl-ACP methyl ester carboxylesterase
MPREGYAEVGGARLHFTFAAPAGATGPVLVLLHGFGGSYRTWDDIMPLLAASRPVLRIDLWGFGLSLDRGTAGYSVLDQARLVCEAIRSLGLRRVVLVGHSYGGAVALLIASGAAGEDQARQLDGLILIASAAYRQRLPPFVRLLRHAVVRWAIFGLVPPESWVRFVLRQAYADPGKIDAARVALHAEFLRLPGARRGLTRTALELLPPNAEVLRRNFSHITTPTLILWGSRDRVTPILTANRLNREIRGSRLVILDGVGHIPHEEAPGPTADRILEFLSSLA